MYARQPPEGSRPRDLRIPRNYSGNAFSRENTDTAVLAAEPTEEPTASEATPRTPVSAVSEPSDTAEPQAIPAESRQDTSPAGTKLFPSPGFRLDFGRLFRKDRGFGLGSEELLLLGVILLVSQSDAKDDLLFLLLLLLFIQ